ncbi:PREDICTED: nuclear pore glycoprotein p62 [Nicrophorus vespilloides]|uniref:Nuclear pore glycoprotein p62 n=1 Tax=Nicrophorus vespilloides TaxID=110193 RepID=A0ABM1MZX4_NICVS|nr:PREDICTED: nuclear pore glycoprotein p62 [Nicrophorus vespilloides]
MSFSFGTPKTDAPAPSFSFGNAGGDAKTKAFGTPAAAAPQAGLNFSFGSGTPAKPASSFTLGASPAPSFNLSAVNKPAPSFNLGGAAASTPAPSVFGAAAAAPTLNFVPPTQQQPASSGFVLGAAATPAASAATPSFNLGGAATSTATPTFSLGAANTAAPLAFNLSKPATTPASSTSGFSLGGAAPTPAATAAAAPGLGLGKSTLSFSMPSATAAATTSAGFSLGAATTTATTTSLPSSLTSASVVPPTGTLTFAQLEDAINKWTIDLEEQGKLFGNQAKQLNAWDRLLISNGEKVLSLNNSIERVKQQQQNLDQELDFVLAQQKELEDLIAPLEKELNELPITDLDRNHTYQLAETMDTQLKQMSEDLKEIIEQLNEANKTQELSNPITQIGKILNAHMNSLQWIDRNTTKISTHLDQVTKMHDINRRSHEKSFQRTYD